MKKIAKRVLQHTNCKNGLKSRFCLVLGVQWGQEGKYKLLNKLNHDYDYACRFNGGPTSEPAELPNGQEINLLPFGIQDESASTKFILGNGVTIDPFTLMNDFEALNDNGIKFNDKLVISNRAHLVTKVHRKVSKKIRNLRNDHIWLSSEDLANAYKPLKMGLRMSSLCDHEWHKFVQKYERVTKTSEQLFHINITKEERERELDNFRRLRETVLVGGNVKDTILLLNDEIKAGKRILVEDCSSSTHDIDSGIYPYTDSFHTTTGAVCTGLGVPEESVETTIGVISALTFLNRAFLSHISHFPSQMDKEDPAYAKVSSGLDERYGLSNEEFEIGWIDLNLVGHAERTNHLSSIFVTHLDLLDDLDEIKICTGYTNKEGKLIKNVLPANIETFGSWKPHYETFPGWKEDTRSAKTFDDLPDAAQTFIRILELRTKKEVTFVSTSSELNKGMLRTRTSD